MHITDATMLRAVWEPRRAALAEAWQGTLARYMANTAGATELPTRLRALADAAVDQLLAAVFDPAATQQIGAALATLCAAAPDALGHALTALLQALPHDLPESIAPLAQQRSALLAGALAQGYSNQPPPISTPPAAIAPAEIAMFDRLFADATIGTAMAGLDGALIHANQALYNILGYSQQELRDVAPDRFTRSDDFLAGLDQIARLARGEATTFQIEQQARHRQGHTVWNLISGTLVRDLAGRPSYVLVTFQNITARKREEQRLQVFTQLGGALSAAASARGAAQVIATAADRLWDWDAFSLTLYEADGDTIHVVLDYDEINGQRTEVVDQELMSKPSPIARRVLTEGPLLLLPEQPTLYLDETWPFGDTDRPSASLMFVPIHNNTTPLGVLTVQSYTPRAYTKADVELLQALADHCGGALERTRAAAWLQQSEARYRAVVQSQTELICRATPDGTLTFVNEAYCRYFGQTWNDLIGQNYKTLLPAAAHATVDHALAQLSPTQPVFTYEHMAHTPGGIRWQQWTDRALFDADGRLLEIQSVGRDITARKQAEDRLRQSEQRLALHIRHTPMAVVEWTPDQIISSWNPAAEAIFGYSAAEAIGQSCLELIVPPAARPHVQAVMHELMTGAVARHTSNENITKDGRRIICEWYSTPLIDDDGAIIGCASLARDVTEERRALEALRRSEATNRALLNAFPDLIVRLDRNGRYLELLGAQQEAWTPRADLIGQTVDDVLPPELAEQTKAYIQRALDTSELHSFEYEWPHGDSVRQEEARMLAYNDHEVLSVVREISGRKRAEAARLQARNLQSLSVLAAGIAHEFNNLLMVMLGSTELARLDLPPTSEAHTNLDHIERAARRAAYLTRQMQAFTGATHALVEPVDVTALIRNAQPQVQRLIGPQTALRYALTPNLPVVYGDEDQLHQALLHIAQNAVDALGDAPGVITIATGVIDASETYLNTIEPIRQLPAGPYVFIEIADTGCGMDQEAQARMFDPFFSTKMYGGGLSLAAVLGTVWRHQGAVEVRSTPGAGTVLRVLLPVLRLHHLDNTEPTPQPALPTVQRVLVVDDDTRVRMVTARLLQQLGCDVVEATDGASSVALLQNAPASLDLVLLDLSMPQMDGRATFHALRAIQPDLRIVLMSGYGEDVAAADLTAHGLAGFLQKPFFMSDLQALLQRVLPPQR